MRVIGTAGHVDHGKSTLVRALTGIDPDRLAEEKEREMTIDLGFAWFQLGEEEVGLIDVPGHRDFIENMLAGVGGIDLALLVVAADEGVMPQTSEHLAILDLLGIQSGIIVLTKTDLVDDPEWIDLVSLEIAEALEGSTLEGAQIVPVSTKTQEGLPALKQLILDQLGQTESRLDSGHARLPIDRVFTLSGFGTIITGTLLDGSLRVGDTVEILPDGLLARIRGLQTHKTKREVAQPGSRVAINLTGVDRDQLRRGQVVARPGQLRPTTLVDVAYRHLDSANKPLRQNADAKLFVGSAEVPARARVIGQEVIEPGQSGWLQLSLSWPVAVMRGDRFILRRPSPGETIGGGVVLDSNPGRRHRRFRPEVLARFEALEAGTPEEIVIQTLLRSGPVEAQTVLERSGLTSEVGGPVLDRMSDNGQIKRVSKFLIAAATWQQLIERASDILHDFHRENPLRLGMSREELRSRLRVPPAVFSGLIDTLVDQQKVVETGTLLSSPTHEVTLSAEQELQVRRMMTLLEQNGVNSPSVKDCREIIGDSVYAVLLDRGDLIQVSQDVVYSADEYGRIMRLVQDYLHENGSITAGQARDLLNTSRKYAIALLEHLDELRLTRRTGDERVLVSTNSA